MFRRKTIEAMIVMAVAGAAAMSGAGLAQAGTAQPAAARHTHAVPAAGHNARALPPGVTPAKHPRATAPTPGFVQRVAPNDVWSCYGGISILSHANQLWVSSELAYWGNGYGMLRARSSSIGSWEQYTFCYDSTSKYWVFSNDGNNQFVSTQVNYGGSDYGMLRAANTIDPWEHYQLLCTGSAVAIQSGANGDYVSTEIGYGGSSYAELRARASVIGPWEQYSVPNLPVC
jgi:hypothetical protein